MANDQENLIAQIGMDLDSWDDGMRQMLADERKIEKVLEDVVGSANDAESALNSIDTDITFDVDVSELDRAKEAAEALEDFNSDIDISIDESELESVRRLIEDIDSEAPTVDIVVDESELDTAKDEVSSIDNATPTVSVDVDDAEIGTAKDGIADIDDETPTVAVDVNKDEVDETNNLLTQIRNIQVINLAMNVTGNIQDILTQLGSIPGIGGILELDNAMASFEGHTGRSAHFLEGLVEDLHGRGITASITDIGTLAETASQLNIVVGEIDDAAAATFNTIAVTGGDANETLTLMNQMIQLGLADSFEQASDIIVTGFQTGANRGGDFLDVLLEYGSTFDRLGIDGADAINLINSGLDAGFGNADRVADAVREMDIRVREAGAAISDMPAPNTAAWDEWYNTLSDTGKALADLDLIDETESFMNGDMSGEEYFNTVIDRLNEIEDAGDRAQAAVAIFGTQAEDIGTEAVTSLDTEGVDVESIQGSADEAAAAITNTIGGAIDEIKIMLNDLAMQFFNSDQLDLQGKLDDAKARIQTFVDEINSGATFGEALEIALDAPGLEEKFHDLESFLGDFLLALADIFADVLSIIPGQEAAAAALRSTVAEMAGGQLTFDISVADDAEGVTNAVSSAVARGVESADISDSLNTAFNEALTAGDVGTAQAIIDYVNNSVGTGISQGLYDAIASSSGSAIFDLAPQIAEELGVSLDDATRMINTGEVRSLPVNAALDIDTADMQTQVDDAMLDMHADVDVMLEAGDVSGAQELAESMGSSLFNEFNRLISEGTEDSFQLAANLAAGAPELGLDITSAAEQAGMSDEDIATLQANAAEAVSTTDVAADQMTDSIETAATDSTTAIDETGDAYSTFSSDTSTAMQTAGDAADAYSNRVGLAMQAVQTSIDGAVDHVQTLISAFHEAQQEAATTVTTTTDVNGSAPGHETGGVFSGESWVGEGGPELISTDTRVAVLNNATSESILSGLAALLSGGYSMGGGSSVTINQTNTFNNNGAAASTASLDRASSAIRGY